VILKCENSYIDLMSVRAYQFRPIELTDSGLVTAITFFMMPKPITVPVTLNTNDVETARRLQEAIGEELAKLVCKARRKENGTLEDLRNIVIKAMERLE